MKLKELLAKKDRINNDIKQLQGQTKSLASKLGVVESEIETDNSGRINQNMQQYWR